jgi:hypothetical protein
MKINDLILKRFNELEQEKNQIRSYQNEPISALLHKWKMKASSFS